MHSAHVTYGSLPTTSTALSLCVDYAAEWCAGESAYEGDLFDDPERVEAALRESAAVGVAPASAGVAEVVASRRDALRLVAKPVELRADPESANSERWLLPQLSGLLGALRGTSMPAMPASRSTASMKSSPSVSRRKEMASPCTPHPKQ